MLRFVYWLGARILVGYSYRPVAVSKAFELLKTDVRGGNAAKILSFPLPSYLGLSAVVHPPRLSACIPRAMDILF